MKSTIPLLPILRWARLLLSITAITASPALAIELPLIADEKAVIEKIADIEGIELVIAAKPGFSARSAMEGLASLGVDKAQLSSVTVQAKDSEKRAITLTHDKAGHVLSITGNGPWLRNDGIKLLTALPELRLIRIDHNIPGPGSKVDAALYSGAGFAALKESKLASVKIGHAFDDDGMKALAQVKALRFIHIGHSKVTDQGIAALANHPNIESAEFSPMGAPKITNKTLATLATLPKIRRIGMLETFVTYAGGFEHLKSKKGQLVAMDLTQSLVLPADIGKLKADHPGIEVKVSTMKEVAEKAFRRSQLLKWASPEAVEYLKREEAR
jgi:hypothetical protein